MIVKVWAETKNGWTVEDMLLPAGKGLYSIASHDMLYDIAKVRNVKILFIQTSVLFKASAWSWHCWNGRSVYSVPPLSVPDLLRLAVLIIGE